MAEDSMEKKCSSAITSRVPELHKVQKNGEQSCAAVMRKGNKLQYEKGDLFSCPATDSLAHCISMDCHMGAGIAVAFKKKFEGVSELREQKKEPGQCAVLKRDGRFVYYLITKKKYNYKPTYNKLRQSLEAMRDHCVENSVSRLSMPRIACGLDRLSWNKVSVMIEEVFQNTDVVITVYLL